VTALALAFAAGILSILSPCVLPLVPIVLGAAVTAHPLGAVALAAGLALSFTALGLLLALVGFGLGIDAGMFRFAAAAIMVVLGAILLVPSWQARLAGADLVVNYRTEDVVAKALAFTGQRGVDRVVDVDFGGNIATTRKLMAMNSTVAVYATNGNPNPIVPMRELMEKCIALRTLVLFALPPPLLAAAQADISKWLAAGARLHNIAAQFPLSETAQAHLAVEKGDKLGTVIVDCAR